MPKIIAITKGGRELARRLAAKIDAEVVRPEAGVAQCFRDIWQCDSIIAIMASGIVVRSIAPLLQDKRQDPGVVILDEGGNFAVSLLSGHLGGANHLAQRVAQAIGAQAVISTASDTLGLTALDLWVRGMALTPDGADLTALSALLVNQGHLNILRDTPSIPLPSDLHEVDDPEDADIIISNRLGGWPPKSAILRPADLVLGIGCNRNTPVTEIKEAVINGCQDNDLSILSVAKLATIDLKADEPGLLALAAQLNKELIFFAKDELNRVEGIKVSPAVLKATGAKGVCEPAALLGAGSQQLLVRKIKCKNVTMAIAQIPPPPKANSTS